MTNQEELYNADDIRRYLENKMSKPEMHDLEQAALDDPFLQDAIDGYRDAYLSGSEKINSIVSELENFTPNTRTKKYRNIVIPIWKTKILRYAVAAIFIGTAGWFVLHYVAGNNPAITTANKSRLISDSTSAITTKSNKELAKTLIDDTANKKRQLPADEKLKGNMAYNLQKQDTNQWLAPGTTPNNELTKNNLNAVNTTPASNPAAKNIVNDRSSKQPVPATTINGRITDKENHPLENITLKIRGTKYSTATNASGRFSLQIPDSNAVIVASAPGYKTSEQSVSWFLNNTLQMEQSYSTPGEVVISSYSPGKQAVNGADDKEIDTSKAVPAGGWKMFTSYFDKNKKTITGSRKTTVVILTFEVDMNGKPGKFKIIQSAGKMIDNEAIRLIKDGPLWINKTHHPSAPVKLTLIF